MGVCGISLKSIADMKQWSTYQLTDPSIVHKNRFSSVLNRNIQKIVCIVAKRAKKMYRNYLAIFLSVQISF